MLLPSPESLKSARAANNGCKRGARGLHLAAAAVHARNADRTQDDR
jgi:hypothetical protein